MIPEAWTFLRESVRVEVDVPYAPEIDVACTMDAYYPECMCGAAVLFINSGGFQSGIFRQYAISAGGAPRFLLSHEISVQGMAAPVPILEQFTFAPLLAAGIAVFDVRHMSGPTVSLEEIARSVHLATAFVMRRGESLGVDEGRVGLWGCSSGGYLALLEALSNRDTRTPRIVVAYYPGGYDFALEAKRFPEVAEGLPLENGEGTLVQLSLKNHIAGSRIDALVIYGGDDHATITTACEALAHEMERGRLHGRVECLPDVSHQFMTEKGYSEQAGSHALSETAQWFQERLGAPSGS